MKALPFKIPKTEQRSFQLQVDEGPHYYDRLHYHPEWQLTAVHQGRGVLYVGNSLTRFEAGSVFLVGSNVPHLLKNDELYFNPDSPGVYAESLFFHANSFGKDFFYLPELKAAYQLLIEAERGIWILGEDRQPLSEKITQCFQLKGIDLFQHFLSILAFLLRSTDRQFLNEQAFRTLVKEEDGRRLDAVFQFSFQQFRRPVALTEAAAVANLSVYQFCRYFKLHTGKTYFEFLNELRVEAACQALIQAEATVAQVAYQVGFHNLSNFNRRFKKIKGMTPSAFRRQALRPHLP